LDDHRRDEVIHGAQSWRPDEPDKIYFTGESRMEAYNHTITADIGHILSENGSWKHSRGVAMDWELVLQDNDILSPFQRSKRFWILEDALNVMAGRRLFETSRGFLGLGPPAVRVGDQVCVLLGGLVLYILRKTKGPHETNEGHKGMKGNSFPEAETLASTPFETSDVFNGPPPTTAPPTNQARYYGYIGECYVHGMMDGQACEDESFSLRDFVLV
jgi:hypothetical protein